MQQLDWSNLKLRGENQQKSFEDLCMFLCCRELKITKIDAYQNQPGLETEPFEVNGKKYGFQCKFFENTFDWSQIEHSILGGKDKITKSEKIEIQYPNNVFQKYKVDKIFVYSNKDRTLNGNKQTVGEKRIENLAKKFKVKIKYVTDKHIMLQLSKPSNFDLAQLYFGKGDEFGFIKKSVNPSLLTFIQSSEYLELPFLNSENTEIDEVINKILFKKEKNFILLGNPGSGKSVFMHKLLEKIGGLDKKNEEEMTRFLTENSALPILVNLKNCIGDTLENILRERKKDYNISQQEFKFIYLLDGLDELSEENADLILFQIYELSQKKDTKKITISCRSGNINRLKTKEYLNDIIEYQIGDLEEKYIDTFFEAKMNGIKESALKMLKKENKNLISEIKDILLIGLLWETIDKLDEFSAIIDLFEKKINLLLDNPKHRKNIENLNILNPKKQKIIELNQDISFEFQKKFQFYFSQCDLQKLILKKFDRLDYNSINTILNYISDLFFETSDDGFDSETTYIYQHRRYQEYFFVQKLKKEYEKDIKIIRELKVISNREFFEGLFLKYLRKEYEKKNNLAGILELNLIAIYLGNNEGLGSNEDYYMDSVRFFPALVSQELNVFNELFEDDNLKIKEKISIDIWELKNKLEIWKNNKKNYWNNHDLKNIWENGISVLLKNIVLFWKAGQKDAAYEFKLQLDKILALYKEYQFFEKFEKNDPIRDPFWTEFENLIYYRIAIKNIKIKEILKNLIRNNYSKISGKEKLVKSFFKVCLKEKKHELFELIDEFDQYEFLNFLDVLKTNDYLPIFISSKSIHNKIKKFIKEFNQEINEKNIFILFFKRFFNFKFSKQEKEFAINHLAELRHVDNFDLIHNKKNREITFISYILDDSSFQTLFKEEEISFPHYDERRLYSALFESYIGLLKGEKKIESLIRDYTYYINCDVHKVSYTGYLKTEISILWADIFSSSNIENKSLLNIKSILLKEENDIKHFDFYRRLNEVKSVQLKKILNETELKSFEEELLSWEDDFPSYIDRCFDLSILFSKINSNKAKFYFEKSIIDGILRHGWRKDIIVSYLLVDSLEILWRNNWKTKDELKTYTENIFNLSIRVTKITDGKGTSGGPYNIIKLISNYDINFAENLKDKLIKIEGSHNIPNSTIKDILISKVRQGFKIEEIEEGIKKYKKNYNYEGETYSEYYEQKFVVYLEIAECGFYTKFEQEEAFNKAYTQIDEMENQNIKFYLNDMNFKDEKLRFKKLCAKYTKPFKLKFEKKEIIEKKTKITETNFLKEIKQCKTKKQIQGKFTKLNNYNNGIILTKYESWKTLVDKTFEINGNLEIFITYLIKNNFLHNDFMTTNSKYFYLGLAAALKKIDTRQEILNYLFKNSGHSSFFNIMKAYEVLGDKNMCLKLFDRYLRFCHLIVD